MRRLKVPASLDIFLTTRCNLRCKHCYAAEHCGSFKKEDELTTNEWIKVLKELAELKVMHIMLQGGEIFVRDDIFEILEVASELFPNRLRLATNGTLINDKNFNKLLKLKIESIGTSIDGMEETHDFIRGKGSFKKTMHFSENLIKYSNIRLDVAFTPQKINYVEFPKVVDFLIEKGINRIKYQHLQPEGWCVKIYDEIQLDFPKEQELFMKMIEEINTKYPHLKLPYHYKHYLDLPKKYERAKELGKIEQLQPFSLWQCSGGNANGNILSDGWVVPCTSFFYFKGGNVKHNSFYDSWNTKNWDPIFELKDKTTNDIPICKLCDYKILCGAGCRAINYAMNGTFYTPDIVCPFAKEIIKNTIKQR